MKSGSVSFGSETRPSRYDAPPSWRGPLKAATPETKFQFERLLEVRSEIPYPRIAAPSPLPARLPSKLPVRLVLVVELAEPLLITRRSEVEAKKLFKDNATLVAWSCHVPPALVPAAGTATAAGQPLVRVVEVTPTLAQADVPRVFCFVGGGLRAC